MNTTKIQITESLLNDIKEKIVKHFHPDQIILFGSQAYGTAETESDIDLLVVMNTDLRPTQRSAMVAQVCRPKYVAIDIIVRTPNEIQKKLQDFDPFLEEILDRGRVLYKSAG